MVRRGTLPEVAHRLSAHHLIAPVVNIAASRNARVDRRTAT